MGGACLIQTHGQTRVTTGLIAIVNRVVPHDMGIGLYSSLITKM